MRRAQARPLAARPLSASGPLTRRLARPPLSGNLNLTVTAAAKGTPTSTIGSLSPLPLVVWGFVVIQATRHPRAQTQGQAARGRGYDNAAMLWHTGIRVGLLLAFERSRQIQTRRYLGGSLSCLVTLMATDFGRVTYLTYYHLVPDSD
jgi:hypothetical protein